MSRFSNDKVESAAGQNEGSAKIFSLGSLEALSPEETLHCFGEHYRSVLRDPSGTDHANIRAFMKRSWDGVEFPEGLALSRK